MCFGELTLLLGVMTLGLALPTPLQCICHPRPINLGSIADRLIARRGVGALVERTGDPAATQTGPRRVPRGVSPTAATL